MRDDQAMDRDQVITDTAAAYGMHRGYVESMIESIESEPIPREPVPGITGAYYQVKHDGPTRAQRRQRGRVIRRHRKAGIRGGDLRHR